MAYRACLLDDDDKAPKTINRRIAEAAPTTRENKFGERRSFGIVVVGGGARVMARDSEGLRSEVLAIAQEIREHRRASGEEARAAASKPEGGEVLGETAGKPRPSRRGEPFPRKGWLESMLLNRFEAALMNNPLRAFVQRRLEAGRLLRMGGPLRGGTALEIGCGRGVGVEVILEAFGAGKVDAFDLDANMVRRAKERLAPKSRAVRLWKGDVTRIPVRDGAYDAVFDFGIIHHVVDWRSALREVHRVLRAGGRLYVEEVLRPLILNPIFRRLFEHPLADRFDYVEFGDALREVGFRLVAGRELAGCLAWYVADKPA